MPYPQYKQLQLPQIDAHILAYWEQERVFEQSISRREGSPSFVFYEGPPSANGQPGLHHVLARTIKDTFCRYHTLKGKQVKRKAGWDTHGLPIELAVEKELGITKEDIGRSISVEQYNQHCRQTVMRYKDRWDTITRKMGYWVDLEQPYITFDNQYIESVWWLLHRLYERGYLYKGYTIQPYSPAAGTGLSSHEINLPGCYREVTDTTVVAMFKAINDTTARWLWEHPDEDVRILAWTTTPWTLPSNTALTVGPDIAYVKVRTTNPYTQAPVSVVLAQALVGKWLGGKNAPPVEAISEPFSGSQLNGLRYEQLIPTNNPIEPLQGATDAFRVITADFVTTEDGTGIVHTAPSFGADDRRAAIAHGIGTLTLVDRQGKFLPTVGEFGGRYVKNYTNDPHYVSVDVDIAVWLKQRGYALNVQKYAHNYPHCWRTDKPILYYPLDSWFIAASQGRERMAELNRTIRWKPESTGTGRFQNWLENLQDWNLSRSRYWGIPLPIWRTAEADFTLCIQSVEHLQREIAHANQVLGLQQSVPADLHRPYIDQIVLATPDGRPLHREPDLIDVWFDSGAMPYAQWHYPFENQDVFERNFPADFIAEGVDQTRGWFYTLHAIATLCFDSVAYKNVVSNGLVLDREGNKMSKSKGNVIDPFHAIDTYGADATRWYMTTNCPPWENLKADLEALESSARKYFGTLFNTYSFFALYANVDGFDPHSPQVPIAQRPEIDRWVLSQLNSLIVATDADYANYDATRAARRIEHFVEEQLSNWYVRLCRKRFWHGAMNPDKLAAYQTLHQCLVTVAQLMSPVAPFYADQLYRDLYCTQPPLPSVHLTDYPVADVSIIDAALEQRMDYAQRIASLVLSLRKREKIRVRQPLPRILLPILDDSFQQQVEAVKHLILTEVNVKSIEYVRDTSGIVKKSIKPNFKTLGRTLGKYMKAAQETIARFDATHIAQLEAQGSITLTLDDQSFELQLEDFVIVTEDLEGWFVATDNGLTVALDCHITPELQAEGTARELVNKIQNLRKSSQLEVTDRIHLYIEPHPVVTPALQQFAHYIATEVLAVDIDYKGTPPSHATAVELLDEYTVHIGVQKVAV